MVSTAMQALDYRNPDADRRDRPPYVPVSCKQLNVGCALIASVLSVASVLVVLQGASDEPYVGYRRYDAMIQVGVGSALIALWCCCCIVVAVLVAARKLSVAWLALLLWGAICVFYLSYSPLGYLEDIEKFVLPTAGGGG